MKTINSLIDISCSKYGSNAALSFAFGEELSYWQIYERIFKTALYLKQIGVSHGDKVAVLADNSPYWGISYLSIVRIGAIAVPILPDFPEADIHHIINDSKADYIFTNVKFVNNLIDIPTIKKVIFLDDGSSLIDNHAVLKDVWAEMSKEDSWPDLVLSSFDDIEPDHIASILYTSGTSGHSKAVMLTHENFCANVNSALQLIPIRSDWTFLSILPISHAYEFTIGFLLPLINGAKIVYAQSRPTPSVLGRICQQEKPDIICVVPMVIEKIYKKRVLPSLREKSILKMAIKIDFLKKIIFRKACQKLLNFLGGNLKLMAIGGAALNLDTEFFLMESGFPYLVGYGLSETSPLLSGGPFLDRDISLGSAGKPIPDVEIKINNADKNTGAGEIFARGPNIMKGYFNDPGLTDKTINREGWLATGDLGSFDEKGNLHILGRIKNVIVLSSGENIFPEVLEEKINAMYHVSESLVIERDNRLEAMVYLDYDLIDIETKDMSPEEVKNYIKNLLKQLHSKINNQMPGYSKISKVSERTEPFIKTATHKIKRYLYTDNQIIN